MKIARAMFARRFNLLEKKTFRKVSKENGNELCDYLYRKMHRSKSYDHHCTVYGVMQTKQQ